MNLDNEIISTQTSNELLDTRSPQSNHSVYVMPGFFLLKDETEDHAQPGRISIIL
ncbi:Uncharacterised protein [Klebsiella aerogenes]|nr:Uncharacterised protein [Klebsiella aerogenes]